MDMLLILFLCCVYDVATSAEDIDTPVQTEQGHYPHELCILRGAWLNNTDGVFYYPESDKECERTSSIWSLQPVKTQVKGNIHCDLSYKIGRSFTIYYWAGGSNYYHMHYDIALPLYNGAYFQTNQDWLLKDTIFMPVVETRRLQEMNWNTDAFLDDKKWWIELVKMIAGGAVYVPLDNRVRQNKQNICFDILYLGAPKWTFDDEKLVKQYVSFAKKSLNIPEPPPIIQQHRLAIISRKGRRKILNEEELVKTVEDMIPTDLIDFNGMTFKEQVEKVQQYSIMVGMNGAGFMNCLYLQPMAYAIQLAPFNHTLNVDQFSQLIKTRGPYMEWINTKAENHRAGSTKQYDHNPDTIVDVQEFRQLIRKAMDNIDSNVKLLQAEQDGHVEL